MKKSLVLGLAGPTASGKSALALRVAAELGGEIVCMDSMQVYRFMDIGTAKPSRAERETVPHHMLDVAHPKDPYSVAEYAQAAGKAVEDILSRGKLPVLCGGTGLYLRAMSRPLGFGGAPSDPAVRQKYQGIADTRGAEALHRLLQERDPESARRLHPNDLRRVVRALEVLELTGRLFSAQEMPGDAEGSWDLRLFALRWPRETLYSRISARAEGMLRGGLPEEVEALLRMGVSPGAQSMQGLGYKELVPCLNGGTALEEAAELIARRTRNYAKRQLTWFNADPRIRWLEGEAGMETNVRRIRQGLEE